MQLQQKAPLYLQLLGDLLQLCSLLLGLGGLLLQLRIVLLIAAFQDGHLHNIIGGGLLTRY